MSQQPNYAWRLVFDGDKGSRTRYYFRGTEVSLVATDYKDIALTEYRRLTGLGFLVLDEVPSDILERDSKLGKLLGGMGCSLGNPC